MAKTFNPVAAFAIGFVLCAATLKALYGVPLNLLPSTPETASKKAVLTSLMSPPPSLKHIEGDSVVADAAAKLEPAIVEMHTVGKAETVPYDNPFGNDPMFRQLFPSPDMGGQTVQPHGAGSGVIISSDGYILTNDHVVDGAETVTVNALGKDYSARVVGADKLTDIAVVKIEPAKGTTFPVAQLGDSDDLRVGDWAIAIGNPLDIGTTVTLGIVSALNRDGLEADNHPLQSLIQTDAAINPGNSGGALANINGQVIGINEAIESPTGYYAGIGFAIPINRAKEIAAELIKDGKIDRPEAPYLGVSYDSIKHYPAVARRQLGLPTDSDNGVVVEQVYPGSPADVAGLQVYDLILEVNRQKITDPDQLKDVIGKSKVGDVLALLVSRNGQNQIVTVTLKARPDDFGAAPEQQPQQQNPMFQFGPGG